MFPEIFAKICGFAHVALVFVRGAEGDVMLQKRFCSEDGAAVPTRVNLKRKLCFKAGFRLGIVPEQIVLETEIAILGDLNEHIAGHAAADPGVVERFSVVDPVHGAGHVRFLIDLDDH